MLDLEITGHPISEAGGGDAFLLEVGVPYLFGYLQEPFSAHLLLQKHPREDGLKHLRVYWLKGRRVENRLQGPGEFG